MIRVDRFVYATIIINFSVKNVKNGHLGNKNHHFNQGQRRQFHFLQSHHIIRAARFQISKKHLKHQTS